MKRAAVTIVIVSITLLSVFFLSGGIMYRFINLRMQGKAVYKMVKALREYPWQNDKHSIVDGYRVVNDKYYVAANISKEQLRGLATFEVKTLYKEENRYLVKFFSKGHENKVYDLFEITKDAGKSYINYYLPDYELTEISNLSYRLEIKSCPFREHYDAFRLYIDYEKLSGEKVSEYYIMRFTQAGDSIIDLSYNKEAHKIININIFCFGKYNPER